MGRGDWTRSKLEASGFTGWVRFGDLEPALQSIPTADAGVYVLLREELSDPPLWVTPSPVGSTWRGDPSVSIKQLEANWVPGAAVVYIGKAKGRQLRKRLRAYMRFGQGRGGKHWGGRLVFQLPQPWDLLVAWRRVDDFENALAIEGALIKRFRADHGGKPPFANNPDRWGS